MDVVVSTTKIASYQWSIADLNCTATRAARNCGSCALPTIMAGSIRDLRAVDVLILRMASSLQSVTVFGFHLFAPSSPLARIGAQSFGNKKLARCRN